MRRGGALVLLLGALLPAGGARGLGDEGPRGAPRALAGRPPPSEEELPRFDPHAEPYRTLRSGQGFRTNVLGRDVAVPPRDRRRVYAWNLGVAGTSPGADGAEALPTGALYFWYHPDDDTLLRAVAVGVFNEVFFAHSPPGFGPFELVATLDSFTVPAARAELADGQEVDEEELLWGQVRPGLGLGFRRQVPPGEQDNMFAATLTGEPGYGFFDDGSDTASSFVVPQDTFEGRLHLQVRWDALSRNLLELPHEGYALGCDLAHGWRSNWERWGPGGGRGRADEDFTSFTGYLLGVAGLPGVESERHRVLGAAFGGVGGDLDRFSAPRVGGGPTPMGEEYGSTWRPVFPGAVIEEFFPERYAVFAGEYRFEPIFFTHLGLRGAVAYLDRDRRRGGRIRREDDVLGSAGLRLTTGFVGETRLQVDYSYSWSVIRQGRHGGHEVVVQISRQF